jgi:putative tryptophan/tyrosine transport system substrate-binding protein
MAAYQAGIVPVRQSRSMRRREFIAFLSSAPWVVRTARAEPKKTPRIGFLNLAPASAWTSQVEAFRAGLRDLGYVEGKNILIEFRWAATVDQMRDLAAELVAMKVDVIVAPASTQVEPARQVTKTIPIVFAQHADPVGVGHVASLARPGGNITGVSMVLTELAAKSLELLNEVLPHATRFAVLRNPITPSHVRVVEEIGRAATSLGLQLLMLPVQTVQDFDGVFSAMTRERVDGFVVPSSPLTNVHPAPLAHLQLKHRLPGIFGNRVNVLAGGLMSYGANFNMMYRHAATYIDKLLRGAKAADLPVEQMSKYDLVINLKTAQVLGLRMPEALLVRADELIE